MYVMRMTLNGFCPAGRFCRRVRFGGENKLEYAGLIILGESSECPWLTATA